MKTERQLAHGYRSTRVFYVWSYIRRRAAANLESGHVQCNDSLCLEQIRRSAEEKLLRSRDEFNLLAAIIELPVVRVPFGRLLVYVR